MLTIRQDQFDSIGRVREDEGNRVLAQYALARFPNYFANHDEAALIAEVGSIRDRAKQYDLQREDLVGTYLDLTIMYGPDFAAEAWAAPFLTNQSLMPEAKIELLRQHVRESGVEI